MFQNSSAPKWITMGTVLNARNAETEEEKEIRQKSIVKWAAWLLSDKNKQEVVIGHFLMIINLSRTDEDGEKLKL